MKDFFTGRKIQVFLHLLAWSILLGLPIYFIKRWKVGNDFVWLYYINTIISGIIFYVNYFLLVPGLFFVKKNYKYYLSVIVIIVCFYFVSDISNRMVFKYATDSTKTEQLKREHKELKPHLPPGGIMMVRPPFREIHLYNYVLTSVFLVFISLGLRVLERHSEIEKMQKEMEREKLNSELAFLKNQVSPHFFFNTLNNIYSLISISPDDSQKAVLKLSKLMRYLLYDSEHGNTRLSSEISFMNNYIDLMRLRMSDKIKLSVSFPEKYDDLNIPPLLFIPFIENAFKHGISYREASFIDITMQTEKDSITFRSINSINKSQEEAENRNSGIGLENVSKRLNLLFPGKHELKINKSDTTFEVILDINIA